MNDKTCGCDNSQHRAYSKSNTSSFSSCGDCTPTDASCVMYTGVKLDNIGVESNSNIEYILQEIDETIGGGSDGSWNYNYSCLDDNTTITNRRQFVETISHEFCVLKNSVGVLSSSIPSFTDLSQRVSALENPNFTSSAFIGITTNDTSHQVTSKFATAVDSLENRISVSNVNWSQNYPVVIPPSSISGGFTEVLRQIGLLKTSVSNITGVGTFDTTSYCLPTKTTTTSLSTVIVELMQADCQNAKFSFPSVTWGCVVAPTTQNFQASFQKVVSVLGGLVEDKSVFDSNQFEVTPLSNCQGQTVKLKSNLFDSDGKVFVKSSSTGKQFVGDIFEEGDNIEIEVTEDSIKISAPFTDSNKVSVTSTGTPEYLEDAVVGGDYQGAISINPSVDTNGQLAIIPSIEETLLADMILNTIQSNPSLMNKLCNLVCGCQNECS